LRSPRETCTNPCRATGHTIENGLPVRCDCLKLEINLRKLGPMFSPSPKTKTGLSEAQHEDAVLEGPLSSVRQHVSRVLLDRAEKNEQWITMDAYRLIEIFLGQDEEFETQAAVTDTDLLIMLLGFGDPRNKYLPELLLQTLNRRELIMRPTWIILGLPLDQLGIKYSTQVYDRVSRMRKVRVS
jgi:hypothetical protein